MDSPRVRKEMEDRFSCPICLSPRLRMVAGLCQHRVCDSCLYDDSGTLSLRRCPVCQEEGCFPNTRPIIPENSVLAQRRLGVVTCPNDGCEEELWEWELLEHRRDCAHFELIVVLDSPSPPPRPVRPRVTVQAPAEKPRRQPVVRTPLVKTTRTSARRLALARQQRAQGTRTPGRQTPGRRVAAARRTPARGTPPPRRRKRTAWRL